MSIKTTYILSRIFAALGITAIPTIYIAICIALYLLAWWTTAILIALTIFLPVLIFQFRNAKEYGEAMKKLKEQNESNG